MSVVVAYFFPVSVLVAVTATPGRGTPLAFTVPWMVPPCGSAATTGATATDARAGGAAGVCAAGADGAAVGACGAGVAGAWPGRLRQGLRAKIAGDGQDRRTHCQNRKPPYRINSPHSYTPMTNLKDPKQIS